MVVLLLLRLPVVVGVSRMANTTGILMCVGDLFQCACMRNNSRERKRENENAEDGGMLYYGGERIQQLQTTMVYILLTIAIGKN